MNNPLFPQEDQPQDNGFVLPPKQDPVQPVSGAKSAADLIREKVAQIYETEPKAKEELAEAEAASPRSKHQEFMHNLSTSGKSLAQIQTDWHNYYINLPDEQKHEVWREFYASHNANSRYSQYIAGPMPEPSRQLAAHKNEVVEHKHTARSVRKPKAPRNTSELRAAIKNTVTAGGKLQAKHHLQSLLFGLGMGILVVVIFLFGFFNEVFLAPFIQPSRHVSNTQLIIDSNSVAPTNTPEVIVPKINVEIPVNYDETSTDEATIENDLQSGIVHYPTTSLPGQNGNTAFFGHSSNNIFNPGKYKFAFVLLHEVVPGDTFYLTKDGKVYVYKVFSRTIVDPSDVGVLDPVAGHTATATLITCDPPGTSLHRLVVVGDQISPDPTANTKSTATSQADVSATNLPGNGPTLWTRWWQMALGKVATLLVIAIAVILLARRLSRVRS